MKPKLAGLLIFSALIAYSVFIFLGVQGIPFHPDESSLLYQSRDFELLLTDPGSLVLDPKNLDDQEQKYRALNAPLTKYVLAIGRRVAGYGPEAVSTDWDWSKTWQENDSAGALPPARLLNGSRYVVTLLLPLSLLFIYQGGEVLRSRLTGYAAACLLGMNALILLHDRRAMAEGVMTFGVCLAILGMLQAYRRPWLAGLGASLAVAAKYSTAPLLLINLLACVWRPDAKPSKRNLTLRNALTYLVVVSAVLFVLSPIAWSNPIDAILKSWDIRQEFVDEQVEMLRVLLPNQVLDTLPIRIAIMLGHLYLTPLQFEEVGNYLAQTASMEDTYQACPLHNLLRGNLGGGVMLTLTIFGFGAGLRRLLATREAKTKRNLSLLLTATFLQIAALLFANPLPYQRYWIPIVPFVCLWIAYGVVELLRIRKKQTA